MSEQRVMGIGKYLGAAQAAIQAGNDNMKEAVRLEVPALGWKATSKYAEAMGHLDEAAERLREEYAPGYGQPKNPAVYPLIGKAEKVETRLQKAFNRAMRGGRGTPEPDWSVLYDIPEEMDSISSEIGEIAVSLRATPTSPSAGKAPWEGAAD